MSYLQIGRYEPSQWYSYELISAHYGIRTAERSGIPLINHIHEGLVVLDTLDADQDTAEAYCLHPLLQGDDTMLDTAQRYISPSRGPGQLASLMLALEYRGIANGHLSHHTTLYDDGSVRPLAIRLGPSAQVRQMLIADKVQNRKDFEQHHKASHPRSKQLEAYFKEWFTALR
jgi:hypothetical protein